MKLHKTSLVCAITLILTISLISNFSSTQADSFTIDLIHRDSLQSPSLLSTFEHVGATLQRSFNRAKTLIRKHSKRSASTDIILDGGEYLMRFSLGTPKVETLAIADTGSDLIWIQCSPCTECFNQKAPLFVPHRSSTYKPISCRSKICSSLETRTSCSHRNKTCAYSSLYGDQSFSKGKLATETVTLGNNVSIHNVIIGCGHNDLGTFSDGGTGIVGLGGGKESLIRQMGSLIGGKFSYCLVPLTTKPSKMHFGDKAIVSGDGVVTTPIVLKYPATYYYLILEGMSVGNQRLNLDPSEFKEDDEEVEEGGGGNIIIDSETTLTFLPSGLYRKVEAAVKRQVSLRRISKPEGQLRLCYLARGDAEKRIPEMTVHFKAADVKLKSYNTFIRTSEESMCLAFAPSTSSGLAIYGNVAQMNFLIGYDLGNKTVSFKPTNCMH